MSSSHIDRRKFLKLSAALGATSTFSLVGCSKPCTFLRELSYVTLKSAKLDLQTLLNAPHISSNAQWSVAKTFIHCAQSIEYSLRGYPENYSPFFHNTAGKAAKSLFLIQEHMRHDLAEPIPGAPSIEEDADLTEAAGRLEYAIDEYLLYSGKLQPHFAYGKVDRDEYTALHAMHIANHFSEFEPAG